MKKGNLTRILFGLACVFLSVLFLGSVLEWWKVTDLDGWWTVFIIIPAISSMIQSGVRFWNLGFLTVGVFLLARAQDWIPDGKSNAVFWLVALLFLGIWLIFGNLFGRKGIRSEIFGNCEGDENHRFDYTSVFSTRNIKNASKAVEKGAVTSVFGSVNVDLSDMTPAYDVKIPVTCVFGQIDVCVPRNCNVVVKGIPVFGDIKNNAPKNLSENLPTVILDATAVFGGINFI